MMSGRPGHEPLTFLPDESRSLPPPKLNDPRLVYTGFLGYCAGLLNNALRMRPVFKAVRDHDMFGYMKLHPEDFPEKEKKTYGEILEVFHPVR